MKKLFLLAFVSFALSLFAQAPPPNLPSAPSASQFTAGAQVVGLAGPNGQALTDAGFRFALTSRMELGTDNYIGSGYHSHFGTVSYALPLYRLLKRTNLNEKNYRAGVKAGAGVMYPTSTANPKVSGLFGGWLQYSPGGNGTFALEAGVDWLTADRNHVAVRFGPALTF